MSNRYPSAGTCTKCGHALGHYKQNISGLCQTCYRKDNHGRRGRHMREQSICWTCRKPKSCPIDKDPRWFICDDCRKANDESDGADRWLDGTAFSYADLHD